jgi:sulfate permease, SulP family
MNVGIGRWLRSVAPDRATLGKDALAGLTGAIGSVPDGMAAAVLAGVNPVHGLYASFAGRIGGGFTSSTRLMMITTTSAAALATGSALSSIDPADRTNALFLVTILAGAMMVVAGVFKLGRYTRFVSHSVMIGFLTGVSVNIIFGQIPDLLGAEAEGANSLAKALDVLFHPSSINLVSALVGVGALILVVVLDRTPITGFSSILALLIPTLISLGVESVARVEDVGTIPTGFPLPGLPDLSLLSVDLVVGALAIAAIVLVQGAGVSESAPNPDGSMSNQDQDFIAQGVGNLASGFFKGQPVGGSVGQTALNLAAGAKTRWASILSGIWILLILVVFSGLVGDVAMPTLAAVLIYAAARSLRIREITTIFRTNPSSQIAMVTTFVATLFLPIAAAVGIGVSLSLLLQVNQEAIDLRVVELVPRPEGSYLERPAPAQLSSHQVTLLNVYGSLIYAGARTLAAKLPDPVGSEAPAVVLRLRGRTRIGATAMVVLANYAKRLASVGGKLYLSGVDPEVLETIGRARRMDLTGPVSIFEATAVIGEATDAAHQAAETWLVGQVGSEDE